MSSQFFTIPCSIGCVTCRYDRFSAASSPTMMSRMDVLPWRSSARRMGRPTMDGNTARQRHATRLFTAALAMFGKVRTGPTALDELDVSTGSVETHTKAWPQETSPLTPVPLSTTMGLGASMLFYAGLAGERC